MRLIHRRLAAIAEVAEKDPSREFLTGIYYRELPEDRVRLVATDGGRMILVEASPPKVRDFPAIPGTEAEGVPEGIIPATAFAAALKSNKAKGVPILQHVAVSITAEEVILAHTDQVRRVPVIPGPYPQYKTVIPGGEGDFVIDVSASLLAGTLKAIAAMQEGGRETGRHIVRLRFYRGVARNQEYGEDYGKEVGQDGTEAYPAQQPFKIEAVGGDEEVITAVVAPMRRRA